MTKSGHFGPPTRLPRLVNVVCERPPTSVRTLCHLDLGFSMTTLMEHNLAQPFDVEKMLKKCHTNHNNFKTLNIKTNHKKLESDRQQQQQTNVKDRAQSSQSKIFG